MADIDNLQIQISATASEAQRSITLLTGKLKTLKEACDGGCGLQSIVNGLKSIRGGMNALDNNAGEKLKSLAEGLKSLQGASKLSISPDLSDTLSRINSAVAGMSSDIGMKLQGFAGGLTSLSQAGKVSISSTLGKHLMEVAQAGDYFQQHAAGMSAMSSALETLGQVSKVSISSTLGSHLIDLAIGLEEVGRVNTTGLLEVSTALSGLSSLKITATTVKNVKELGAAVETLVGRDFSGLEKLNEQLTQMAQSLPKVAENIPALNTALGQLDRQTEETSESAERAANSYTNLYAAFQLARHAITAATRTIAGWIDKSNSYIENVNLFTASMGEYAKSAQDYAEKVGDLMGIDPGSWMRNQGVFQTLSTGFGVAADRAAIMSKNLTQLGYDLSSFFNIAVEGEGGAMQKLQAGLAGELEPLRRLGFDLSEARLKAVALSLGIDKTYKSMTQAEKAQLRYYAILNQVTVAQGDMARTLNSPANQLRVLKAQVEQAARALGNVFIPLLNAVLPYLIAVAKAVRIVASALAALFGFEMPEVDYSGISTAAAASEDLNDGLGKSAKNAKKLNELLADWDELNIIASENNSNGKGSGAGGSSGFDFDLPEYDFLAGLVESNVNKIMETLKPALDWIQEHIKAVLDLALLVGAAFLAWKIDKTLTGTIGKAIKFVLGLAIAIYAIGHAYEAFMDQWNNGIDMENMASLFKYLGLLAIGLWFMFGKKGLGIGLLVDGIILAINPIKELIETGELTEEAFYQLEVAIGAVGIAFALLTGSWIPLVIAAVVGIALAIWQNWDEIKAWWNNTALPFLEKIWDWINTNIVQPIVSGAIEIYNNVTSWAVATYNSVVKWVTDLYNSVAKWVSDTYNTIATWVINAYNTVVSWVTNIYNDVVTWVKDTYDAVAGWVASAYSTVVTWVQDIYNGVVGWATDLYNSVVTTATNTYNDVVSWVTDLYNSIVSWVITAYNDVSAWFGNIYNSIVGWVVSAYNSVVTWFGNIRDGISGALRGVYTWWNTTAYPWIQRKVEWINTNIVQPVLYFFESLYLGVCKDLENIATWWYETALPWLRNKITWIDSYFVQPIIKFFAGLKQGIVDRIAEIKTWWNNTALPWISAKKKWVEGWIASVVEFFAGLKQGIIDKITEIKSWWTDTAVPWLQGKATWINDNVINPIVGFFAGISQRIQAAVVSVKIWWFGKVIPWFTQKVTWIDENVIQPVVGFFKSIPEEIKNAINGIGDWWSGTVLPWMTSKLSWIKSTIKRMIGWFQSIPTKIKDAIAKVGTWWNETVMPWITEKVELINTNLIQPITGFAQSIHDAFSTWLGKVREEGLFTTLIADVKSAFEGLATWFDKNVTSKINGVFIDMVNGIIDAINWIIEKLNSFNFTIGPWNLWDAKTIHIGWPINQDIGIPAFGIPQVTLGISGIPTLARLAKPEEFAEGGFPETGQMFFAREEGAPELVGSIGGRTAVANNDQIEAGIAEGVREANSEQNDLLQIANQYLRIIASKSGNNSLRPSVDLARTVKRSEELRLMAEGV